MIPCPVFSGPVSSSRNLGQSFLQTLYRQRIKACYNHKANGLKKEPNDTGGPNIDTKINELELAIRDLATLN